jgi:hypothetical protein
MQRAKELSSRVQPDGDVNAGIVWSDAEHFEVALVTI